MSKENCSEHLHETGQTAPRTCAVCKLGPCKYKKRELKDLTKEDYEGILKLGFLYEFHPEATGNWYNDCGQYQEPANKNTHLWKPINSAPLNRYILIAGDSGYITTPLRVEVAKWSHQRGAWLNHAHDYFTDGGTNPIYWAELLEIPVK